MIVQIGEPDARPFTPVEQRIKAMLDDGVNPFRIALAMHMGIENVRDHIFEIRRKESINMGKLNEKDRQEIIRLSQEGIPQTEIARQFNVSGACVCKILKKQSKPGIINPEFDAAVDEMIADAKTADAENKPEPIKQTAEPVTMTEEHTAEIPEAVIRAVTDKISMLHGTIVANKGCIERLTQQNENYEACISVLEAWLKEVHCDGET